MCISKLNSNCKTIKIIEVNANPGTSAPYTGYFKIGNEVDIVTELLHHMRSGNEMAKYDEVVF
jgi:hypothetical protein